MMISEISGSPRTTWPVVPDGDLQMVGYQQAASAFNSHIARAEGEAPIFKVGDRVVVSVRSPVGHYRVPQYVRGKRGSIEAIIDPAGVNNEEEGFGRNAGLKRRYYRVAIPLTELWPDYVGLPNDGLRIEIFETWLERI